MAVELSQTLVAEAKRLLEDLGELEGPITVPSSGNEVSAILSASAEDLIPLQTITHRGETYYLGIPKNDD